MAEEEDKSEHIDYAEYFRCRTCGDFFDKKEAVKEVFCSNFCASKYRACENCGKYFVKVLQTDDNYCSDKCRFQYVDIIEKLKTDQPERGDVI